MKKNILIINRDNTTALAIKDSLVSNETNIVCASDMHEALVHIINTDFCLIILDADVSAEDDHKLLKAIRKAKNLPILVLSSDDNHDGRIHAFQAGAHAYMGHPYTLEECLAQAHTLMQLYLDFHPQGKRYYTLAFGQDLVIDPTTRQVFVKGKEIKFTRKEFDLLFCLASNPGKVFSREQLFDHVWDEHSAYNIDDVVKHHIKTLRRKLTVTEAEYIKNVWGLGYRFEHDTVKDGE